MAFITEKEELKPGLILFRRGDVDHRMWYCRMKMPKADRYKTFRLKHRIKKRRGNAPSIRTRTFDSASSMTFLCSTAPSARWRESLC
jgi:integrase